MTHEDLKQTEPVVAAGARDQRPSDFVTVSGKTLLSEITVCAQVTYTLVAAESPAEVTRIF